VFIINFKKSLNGKEERKGKIKERKNERGSRKVKNVQECTLLYWSQSSCKQPTLQFQSATFRV
jgi:hypothetical protein